MGQEFEYTAERRVRYNTRDEVTKELPSEPVWGEWTAWAPIKIYRTLAGAAMASGQGTGLRREYYGNKAPYYEQQTRVSYRLVTATWTPLLPELGDKE